MNVIQKLKDHKIFKENSLIESTIEKSWMGSPITVKGTLIVKKLNINDCICEEYQSASDKIYKIRYFNCSPLDFAHILPPLIYEKFAHDLNI